MPVINNWAIQVSSRGPYVIAQELRETRHVLRRGDDQDVAHTCEQ